MGESTDKLDRMAEWTATPAGIENDLKNIQELELNGKYSEALTYIKKSGNPLLNGLVDRLTKQQVARSGDNYKSKRKSAQTLVAQLVTLNPDQKDIDGRPDVAAVQSDLTRHFDKELTKLIDLGTPADEAIDRASELTTKYWVDNGGGQKTSKGATGKFAYNDQGGIKIRTCIIFRCTLSRYALVSGTDKVIELVPNKVTSLRVCCNVPVGDIVNYNRSVLY